MWKPFRSAIPTQSSDLPFNIVRDNAFAQFAASAAGIAPSWSYTNSVTRAEGTPGTAAKPLRKYWYRDTGNRRKWVKAVLTWTGSDLTKIALYFSEDNETTYVPMVDDGLLNYVLTLVYDGSSNLTSTSWGNTP